MQTQGLEAPLESPKQIYEVVLTGGPCAGKTTATAILRERFSELGFRVLSVPEVATLLITGGLSDIGTLAADRRWFLDFEDNLLGLQRDLRSTFVRLAEGAPEERVLILYDRAEMDLSAYLGNDDFHALLAGKRLTLADVRDSYQAVIHLRTAALGAETAYTTSNNAARRETIEQARDLDEKTLNAWVGHPHLRVIDNSTDFEAKLQRTVQAISAAVGMPVPLEIERKFLLAAAPDLTKPEFTNAVTVEIEQIYLTAPLGLERRIRQRSQAGMKGYTLTEKHGADASERIERERIISAREYNELRREADPARFPIRKARTCFVYNNQYFELDHITEPRELWLLEIELTDKNQRFRLPPSLRGAQDVTRNNTYRNATIAHGGVGGHEIT